MKHLFICLLFIITAGCCKVGGMESWQVGPDVESDATLYKFRLEHSQETRFSGLLAVKKQQKGMEGVLLDATGIQLVNTLTRPDGSKELLYCATAVCDTKLPELVGKVIEYIYFVPANTECPWYAFSCVCQEEKKTGEFVKWKRWGPLRLWQVNQQGTLSEREKVDVRMCLSSVTVNLVRIEGEERK